MKLLDTNLLIYAVNSDAPLHAKAKRWLEAALSGAETIAFSWVALLAFIRLTTRPGVFDRPISVELAFDFARNWLEQPPSTLVHPGPKHLAIMRRLVEPLGAAGNLTMDAHLATLAMEQGAELCSCDSDFARFPELRWRNPLV